MNENKKMSNFSLSVLQEALSSGILDIDSVLDTLMSTKKEKILKIHPYSITAPASDKGRWQTCYIDERGKRKNIKAQTKEELLDKLIPIYFANTHLDNLTFHALYQEWLEYKVTIVNSIKVNKTLRKRNFINTNA